MVFESPNLTTLPEADDEPTPSARVEEVLFLVLVWCRDEPWRVGEVLVPPDPASGGTSYFGRGPAGDGEPPKTHLSQLRPGFSLPSTPLSSLTVSRYQLRLRTTSGAQLLLENAGRAPLFLNQKELSVAHCEPGDLIQVGKQLLFLCVRESAPMRAPLSYPEFPFGEADDHGVVGESAEAWRLRQKIVFAASRRDPVLVQGAAGTGKELVAQAIHAASARKQRPFITGSAAVLSGALADLELLGNSENYPGAGHPERSGLLEEADGSSLLIRAFDRLTVHVQEALLRAVEQGSRQRFGDRKALPLDVRLLVTSETEPCLLPARVAASFDFILSVPDLNARRGDIPLLARHVLRREAKRGDELARRCFPAEDFRGEPFIPLHVMRELLELKYTSHVRELKARLWQALAAEQLGIAGGAHSRSSRGSEPPAAAGTPATRSSQPPAPSESDEAIPGGLSAAVVQAALDQNNGVVEATWRALGLKNRFVLLRLIKRYDLEIRKRPALSGGRVSKRS